MQKNRSSQRGTAPAVLVLVSATAWSFLAGAWLVLKHPQLAGQIDWLIVRASGITAFALLTAVVGMGLLMANPRNKTQWRLTPKLMPWHRSLAMVTLSFLLTHLTMLLLDHQSGFGWRELFVPMASGYRPIPVAFGIVSLYLLIITLVTAHMPRLLPKGGWLRIHRIAAATWVAAWFHGILAGTDTPAIGGLYQVSGFVLVVLLFLRYWLVADPVPAGQKRRNES